LRTWTEVAGEKREPGTMLGAGGGGVEGGRIGAGGGVVRVYCGNNRAQGSLTVVPQSRSRSSFMEGENDRLRENPLHKLHPSQGQQEGSPQKAHQDEDVGDAGPLHGGDWYCEVLARK
jgi:hypothetical protein